jgi:TatA/E family protein of Tat protein translocase
MFGIGMTELVVILVIALLIFGPNKLPELARSLGRGFGEFRRASYDLRESLMQATEEPPEPTPRTREEANAPAPPRDQADAPPPPAAAVASDSAAGTPSSHAATPAPDGKTDPGDETPPSQGRA